MNPPTAEQGGDVSTPAIILMRPQLGENIGAVARIMANFGLQDLRLIAPRDGWPNERARVAASGADWVLEKTQIFASAEEAIAELTYLGATTARPRDMIKPVLAPESCMREMRDRAMLGERTGVLFGPENAGLDNDTVALADVIVTAPVNPSFASLNLAQCVALVAYEWQKARGSSSLGRQTEFDGPAEEGLQMQATRPASRAELVGFFEHLEQALDASGFLKPPEKRPIMVRNIRNMFLRAALTEQEVRTLRGIVASFTRDGSTRRGSP